MRTESMPLGLHTHPRGQHDQTIVPVKGIGQGKTWLKLHTVS